MVCLISFTLPFQTTKQGCGLTSHGLFNFTADWPSEAMEIHLIGVRDTKLRA